MQTIHIAGQNLPISFGFGAIMAYEAQTKRPVLDLFASFQDSTAMFSDMVVLIACGLNNGARRARKAQVYAIQDVADMLDDTEDPMEAVTQAMELLAQSFTPASEQKKTVRMQPTKTRKAG